ncbi:uncharacterized protein LOC125369554 [Ricinus communis]|uniref:uncharacterized protein LOC125369554 n=1 Tax=Ricinus communis TaxID=3988 RepID=UPI00201A9529|nr:uncharacterized protein LOC125369554 [Ricinus communis]
MAIFHDMIEESMEVFMGDFRYLCHFIVRKGIVLGHKISHVGMEVDKAKVKTITKLPPPSSVKVVMSFLGHIGFELLKEKLTTALIMVSPNWELLFELICHASDFAVGAVLGQRIDNKFQPIYYASKRLIDAQEHYTTTEKELLAVIKDKKGAENLAADHLSRLENPSLDALDERAIDDSFSDENLCSIQVSLDVPWLFDFANYLIVKVLPKDQVIRRCVFGEEILQILRHCHEGPTRDHQATNHIARKVLDTGFYLPTIFRDAREQLL